MIKKINFKDGGFSFITEESSDKLRWTSQKHNIDDYFDNFLQKEKFENIIMLGTYCGGFEIILDEIKQKNNLKYNIHTVDISMCDHINFPELLEEYSRRNIKFLHGDIFSEEIVSYTNNLINAGRLLLMCDGGNKIKEFNYYSDLIKTNDIIMVHDYSDNNNNYGWNWIEITHNDIKDAILKNNLENYQSVNFNEVVWACYKKI
jgi:hypothetical protein